MRNQTLPARARAGHLFATFLLASLWVTTVLAAVQYERLKSIPDSDGYSAQGRLLEGSDGMLYGTTWAGGSNSAGTVFKLNKDGSGWAVLHHFGNGIGDGKYPMAGLVEGRDGALYGTTDGGGHTHVYVAGDGTVFKLNRDGTDFRALHLFDSTAGDGIKPGPASLVQGSDGALYGSTIETVFRLNTNGTGYTVVHRAGSLPGDGGGSHDALVEGADGALYGASWSGGSDGVGTVFRVNKNGSGYAVLRSFSMPGGDGHSPGGLIQGSDGALYGTAYYGGSAGVGTIFKISTNGSSYTILHSFTSNIMDGQYPGLALTEGSDGALYGVTYGDDVITSEGDVVFRLNKDGSGYAVLHRFGSSAGDGRYPVAGLARGSDGALYGTTSVGGDYDAGTVFKLSFGVAITRLQRNGTLTALNVAGVPFASHRIQARTNLIASEDSWVTIATNVANVDGTFQLFYPEPPNRPTRFYRVIWP